MSFRYLTISRAPDTNLLELLSKNVIGTPGKGMLYQHLNVRDKLIRIREPYFANLLRAGQVVGTCCFCKRTTLNNGESIGSFYIRYFSFQEIFRRKSITAKTYTRNSGIRREVESVLTGVGLNTDTDEKFFHYAFVDPRNERSAILCREFGFETVRTYTTVVFSRLFPKKDSKSKIVEVKSELVEDLLKNFYAEFNMVSFENLSGRKYYFIEDPAGQRVAGVQVNPDQWKIHSLPGFFNKLLGVFTYIPVLNRLLSKNFRFLTFEAIYLVPGFEKQLEKLFENLLARYEVYAAICVVDAETELYRSLKLLQLGLMNKLNQEVRGNVICRFENFTEAEKAKFKSYPSYISGIDAT